MELNQVRYFVTLCRLLNFTRAAEACNVTQPALTRAIQRLEDELGGPLLFRERNLTQLTELGREMLPHLEAMVGAADTAVSLATAKLTQPRASLRIGLGPGIGATAIAGAVREVARHLPNFLIGFKEGGPAKLAEAMLGDALDCALLPAGCIVPDRLNRWPLYSEAAVVVLPADHPLTACKHLTASDLLDETILLGDSCGGFAERLGIETNLSFRIQYCTGSITQMLDLVGAGLGLALIS
ncbi:MAG: LysR family transcriptional regulator, partial [Acidiphilium sp. 21-62-4]